LGGLLTLVGSKKVNVAERSVISFFGIRGIGSIFYLSFALEKGEFPQAELLWAILSFTMLVSIVLHGVLATPIMNWLDRRHGRKIAAEISEEEQEKEQQEEAATSK
jgi:NhaP-type Na+/H+ or K+/H+ antiporter